MKRIALVGKKLIHHYMYPALLNRFDRQLFEKHAMPWVQKVLEGHTVQPIDSECKISVLCCEPDDPQVEPLMSTFGIETFTSDPREAAQQSDGALVLEDDGDLHLALARPFLERGLPVYVDKPFAKSLKDARAMLNVAKEYGAPVLAGSSLRFAPENEGAHGCVAQGGVRLLLLVGPGEWFTYGSHIVEWGVSLLGTGACWVEARESDGALEVSVGRDDGVRLRLVAGQTGVAGFQGALFGRSGSPYAISLEDRYSMFRGVPDAFAKMLHTGVSPVPYDQSLEVVSILEAGFASLRSGERVELLGEGRAQSA